MKKLFVVNMKVLLMLELEWICFSKLVYSLTNWWASHQRLMPNIAKTLRTLISFEKVLIIVWTIPCNFGDMCIKWFAKHLQYLYFKQCCSFFQCKHHIATYSYHSFDDELKQANVTLDWRHFFKLKAIWGEIKGDDVSQPYQPLATSLTCYKHEHTDISCSR